MKNLQVADETTKQRRSFLFNYQSENIQFKSLDDDDEMEEVKVRNERPEAVGKSEVIEKTLQNVVATGKPIEMSGKDLETLYAISQRNGWTGGALRVDPFYTAKAEKTEGKVFVFETEVASDKITARRSAKNGVYYTFPFESGSKKVPVQNCLLPLGLKSIEKGQTVKIVVSCNTAGQWSYNAEF